MFVCLFLLISYYLFIHLFPQGITLEQFLSFGMFLNNLEDFTLAMRIYSIAGQAVTQGKAFILPCTCFFFLLFLNRRLDRLASHKWPVLRPVTPELR